ncbi:group 1 truncated hemoglobin [Robbsia sp. KACC 23696]|uniref:group I truncated hemoglobin n=1 Tax=Robbsia sp. KACC 23696 TaxID=3149231 RepID=UPI00325B3E33
MRRASLSLSRAFAHPMPPLRALLCSAAVVTGAMVFAQPAHAAETLYQQFGGEANMTKIIDDFYANLLADPRTKDYFDGVSLTRVKRLLGEQFCMLLDGGCTYTGRSMKQTHAGDGINRVAFDATIEDLQKAMDKHGIPFRLQNKLLAKLAPMYRDIQDRQ